MADCPKCRGRMTPGFPYLPDTGGRVKWLDGEPNLWKSLAAAFGIGGLKVADLTARRCGECGFVEFFADPSVKPVKTLSSVDEETEMLRGMVTRMQERIAVLETIATDPAERTAREIEKLRDPVPPAEESGQR